MGLIDYLIAKGWLKTPEIIRAFKAIKRVDFLPDDLKDLAEINEALPIGNNQTISQPLVVAFMLELLQPEPGQKILDIGCGSGYTTALLARIVGGNDTRYKILDTKYKSKVVGVEIIPELAKFARDNVAKYNFVENGIAEIICADGSKGYAEESPYDKILVSASLQAESPEPSRRNELPEALIPGWVGPGARAPRAWKEQLKIGGRIVTPIGNSIWLFIKKGKDEFEEIEYPGFVFVPLVSK
ncbi:MAG: protein-L-isoaspartate O-methyltransferase [bacterium]|nr:protein-L-isoaspartate O-methyltransferase [bacterium]